MSTTTKSNTLPAIRALLWERWLGTIWITLLALALGGPIITWFEGYWIWNLATNLYQEVPTIGLGSLIAGLMMLHAGPKGYSIRLPEHLLRAPVSTRKIALTHLANVGAGALILSCVIAAWYRPTDLPQLVASAGFVLSTVSFSLAAYAVVALSALRAPSIAVLLPALFWICFLLPARLSGAPLGIAAETFDLFSLRFSLPCMLIAVIAFPAGISLLNHARSNHGVPTSSRFSVSRLAVGPPKNYPLLARVWYEWRLWGNSFTLITCVVMATSIVSMYFADELADQYIALDAQAVAYGFACMASMYLLLADMGKAGNRGNSLVWTAPVSTRTLLLSRVIVAVFIAMAVTSTWLAFAAYAAFSMGWSLASDAGLALLMASYLFIVILAFVPLALYYAFVALALSGLMLVLSFLEALGIISLPYGASHLVFYRLDSYTTGASFALLGVIAIWTAYRAHRIRVLSWKLPFALAFAAPFSHSAVSLIVGIIEGDAVLDALYQSILPQHWWLVWLGAASVGSFAITWHALWLHHCRHGGLGWRFGIPFQTTKNAKEHKE